MPKNIYKLKDGTVPPTVSQVANMLDKGDGFTHWAWKLGTQGIEWKAERDKAGNMGTLAHAMIMAYWSKEVVDIKGYTVEEVGQAYLCYRKFLLWPELPDLEIITMEEPRVSEELGLGGTPDIEARVKSTGKIRRIDAKTSSYIYDSHWWQLAGYDDISELKADEHQILWIPKNDKFDCPIRKDLRKEKKIFRHLLEIHKLRRQE